MSKASLSTINTGAQSVVSGGTINLGSISHRFGNSCGCPIINLNGSGITVTERGYYNVNATVTLSPLATGSVTVALYRNGVAVPGATATGSVTTAGNPVTLPIVSQILEDNGSGAVLTLVLSGNAATINNVSVRVDKA